MKRLNLQITGIEEGEETQGQRHRKYFQQNHKRKFPQPKERGAYQGTNSPRKEIPHSN